MHDAEHEHRFDLTETFNKQILCQKKEGKIHLVTHHNSSPKAALESVVGDSSPGVTTQILLNMCVWLRLVCISVSLKATFKGSSTILDRLGKGHTDSPPQEQQALPES